MNSYSVKISYEDREKGREETTAKVDATTIAGAIAKASREFIKGLDRKQGSMPTRDCRLKRRESRPPNLPSTSAISSF